MMGRFTGSTFPLNDNSTGKAINPMSLARVEGSNSEFFMKLLLFDTLIFWVPLGMGLALTLFVPTQTSRLIALWEVWFISKTGLH